MSCNFQFTVICVKRKRSWVKQINQDVVHVRVQRQMSHFLSHWFVYQSMFKIKPAVNCSPGSDVDHFLKVNVVCEKKKERFRRKQLL